MSRRKGRAERANAKREWQLFGLAPSDATCLLLVWLVPFAVLLYTAPRGIEESVRVLDPPAESTLSGEATWSPPLSLILPDGDLAEWPYLIFALVGATLFAAIELILARSTSGWFVAIFAVGASAATQPRHLIPAVLILLARMLIHSERKGDRSEPNAEARRSLRIALVTILIAASCTIEFGFVLVCLLPAMLPVRCSAKALIVLIVGATVSVAFLSGGHPVRFVATMLRPVNWLGVSDSFVSADLLRSSSGQVHWGPALIVSLWLVLLCVWIGRRVPKLGEQSVKYRWLRICLPSLPLAIGLSCSWFLWLAALGVALMGSAAFANPSESKVGSQLTENRNRWRFCGEFAAASLVLVALLEFPSVYSTEYQSLLRAHETSELIDPATWQVGGRVLLLDPGHAPDWQSQANRARFQLLIADRWESWGARRNEVSETWRDLCDFRRDQYLRPNGTWGGYAEAFKNWSPEILVVPSANITELRKLALNPEWSILAIDGRRTVFGRRDKDEFRLQRRRVGNILAGLEWPSRPLDDMDLDLVITAANETDMRRVAAVLCAIRLPFAALRVLPPDTSTATEKIRAVSYLEAAHRTRRHAGQPSLLHQFRALALIRKLQDTHAWTITEQLRIAASLTSLDQPELQQTLCDAVLTNAKASYEEKRQATRIRHQLPPNRKWDESDAEQQLRRAMLAGDTKATGKAISRLDSNARAMFSILTRTGPAQRQRLYEFRESLQCVDADEIWGLPENQSELLFMLGDLALLANDPNVARTAFQNSKGLLTTSPFRYLGSLNLAQLNQ